ncbi:MAG: hypothetical protein JO002_10495 [Burkholderiaceae bacterium]|nr:hypothetical protein [Burkholderiaceae bacterium]
MICVKCEPVAGWIFEAKVVPAEVPYFLILDVPIAQALPNGNLIFRVQRVSWRNPERTHDVCILLEMYSMDFRSALNQVDDQINID